MLQLGKGGMDDLSGGLPAPGPPTFVFLFFSRPIALAIRVLVGFKREYRQGCISYPRFAAIGVALDFCHTSNEILRILKITFQNLNKPTEFQYF